MGGDGKWLRKTNTEEGYGEDQDREDREIPTKRNGRPANETVKNRSRILQTCGLGLTRVTFENSYND